MMLTLLGIIGLCILFYLYPLIVILAGLGFWLFGTLGAIAGSVISLAILGAYLRS